MKSLNIPLTRSRRTARPLGRAVWRSGILVLFFLVLFFGLKILTTHNPFLNAVPEGTRFMVHLRPTTRQWSTLLRESGNEVLAGTGITLNELAPLTRGSLVLFLTTRGETVIGIQGNLDEATKSSFLAQGIHVEPIAPHLFLLAETPQNLTTLSTQVGIVGRLLPHFAGSITDLKEGAPHAIIRVNKTVIALDFPVTLPKSQPPLFTDQTIFAGTFTNETLLSFPVLADHLFSDASGGTTLTDLFLQNDTNGSLSLFEDGSYFVSLNTDIPLPLLQKFLILQYQLAKPTEMSKILRDGTTIPELRIEKEVPAIETIEEMSWTILRLDSEKTSLFAVKNKENGSVFFTNSSEALLKATKYHQEKNSKSSLACGNSDFFSLSIDPFISYLQNNKNHFSTPLPLSNSNFVHVGIDKSVFGKKIRFCGDNFGVKKI